jgi:hypothetical protein
VLFGVVIGGWVLISQLRRRRPTSTAETDGGP